MTDRVTQYCRDVLDGKEPAGHLVALACRRHLNDIEKSRDEAYPYVFDVEKAADIIEFAESLTIPEGYEYKPVKLYPFQVFILGSLNGWVRKKDGYRRFRTSYVQLGRQNGKSFLNGILAAYYGNFAGYQYGQIYCVATKKDQAKIVFNSICQFIRADRELSECFEIKEYKSEIICNWTQSTIRALGKDTDSIDGFRPLLGIVDEYHAHKTNQMFKLLEGGIKRMKEALISVITTAGFNLSAPCHGMYETCVGILNGVFEIESRFVYIAQLDEGDDLWSPDNWVKANPALIGDTDALENMVEAAQDAKINGGEDLRDFMTKQLDIWVQFTDNQYITHDDWRKGACDMTLEDFRGQSCTVGLDLSSGGDLTSFVLEFVYYVDDRKYYFLHSHSFIPSRRVVEHIKTDDAPYDMWIREGLLTVTETNDGIKTDYKYIIAELVRLRDTYELTFEQLGYDPHNADAFLSDLQEIVPDCVEIYQSHKYLNDSTEDFRLEVQAGNVRYNRKNSLLSWSVTNAKTVSNSYGEIKIDKEKRQRRIDPVDAIIDAHKLTFKQEEPFDINKSVELYLQIFGEEESSEMD